MRKAILLFLLVLFIAGCNNFMNKPMKDTNTSLAPSLDDIDETAIRKGDLVSANYVLSLEDGTVVDTNNAELAKKSGLKNYATGPYKFIVDQSNKIKSFDETFMGKHSGENGTVSLSPLEPEQKSRIPREQTFKRNIRIPIYRRFSLESFENIFKKPPIVRDLAFSNDIPFKYQIVNVTDSSVYAKMLANTGDEVTLEGTYWSSIVLTNFEKEILLRQNPEDNQEITTQFGNAVVHVYLGYFNLTYYPELGAVVNHSVQSVNGQYSSLFEYEIREVNEHDFVLRRYNYLPQEKLVFEYEILDVIKSVK